MPAGLTTPPAWGMRKPPVGRPLNRAHPLLAPGAPPTLELFAPLLEGGGATTENFGVPSYQGVCTATSWAASPLGPALSFNGTGSMVEMDTGTALSGLAANATVEGWMRVGSASMKGCAFHVGSNTGSNGFSLGVGSANYDTAGNHLIALYDAVRWIDTGVVLPVGWHHAGLVVDPSGHPIVYLDGRRVYSDATGAPTAAGAQRYLGVDGPNNSTPRWWPDLLASMSVVRRVRAPWEFQQIFLRPFQMFV